MIAVVVYESLWGNTAAIANAIAEGLGPGTPVLTTSDATSGALSGVDLIVAGAPLLGFQLATEKMRNDMALNPAENPPAPPDLSHPAMRTWLETVPAGSGRSAGFETRLWWSPGSAAKKIASGLAEAGYASVGTEKFIVTGRYGPLKDGEIERARAWGAELASTAG